MPFGSFARNSGSPELWEGGKRCRQALRFTQTISGLTRVAVLRGLGPQTRELQALEVGA
jgi:hypothetical protein